MRGDREIQAAQNSKPSGVTLCQFDSDLRHHVFRHEKTLRLHVRGLLLDMALPPSSFILSTRLSSGKIRPCCTANIVSNADSLLTRYGSDPVYTAN